MISYSKTGKLLWTDRDHVTVSVDDLQKDHFNNILKQCLKRGDTKTYDILFPHWLRRIAPTIMKCWNSKLPFKDCAEVQSLRFIAGADIKKGDLVHIGHDGLAYPLYPMLDEVSCAGADTRVEVLDLLKKALELLSK